MIMLREKQQWMSVIAWIAICCSRLTSLIQTCNFFSTLLCIFFQRKTFFSRVKNFCCWAC